MVLDGGSGWGMPTSTPNRKNYLSTFFFQDDDKSKTPLLKNENLKMCKTSLFNLQKSCLSASKPLRKILIGLIKLVFIPDELATLKANGKRKSGLKPIDQRKHSIARFAFYFMFFLHLYEKFVDVVCNLLFLHTFSWQKYRLLPYSMHSAKQQFNHEWLFS